MGKTDNEIINEVLLFLYKKYSYRLENLKMIPSEKLEAIYYKLIHYNLIVESKDSKQLTSHNDHVEITNHGRIIIIEHGNYLAFLRAQKKANNKTTIKTWTPIVATIVLGIISSIFLWLNYTKGEEIKRKDAIIETKDRTIEQMKRNNPPR